MLKNKKIGIGIIGCGRVSTDHLEAFMELNNDCEIKAVADPNLDNAKMLIKNVSEEIEIYNDIVSLLERDDIDLVSICTPRIYIENKYLWHLPMENMSYVKSLLHYL